MLGASWARIWGILGILILVFVNGFWIKPIEAASQLPAISKVSSLLSLRIELKQKRLSQVNASPQSMDNSTNFELQGFDSLTSLDNEQVFLHFVTQPGKEQLDDLVSTGVVPYPESWIPPFGNHPTGFILAEMPVDKLNILAAKSYLVNLNTAEEFAEPQNDLARTTLGVNTVWSSGYTGAGVTVAVLDSGIDNSNGDFPALNTSNSKDYSLYPDLDDTIANTVTGHGTHVAGSVLGRGVNSSTYKGVAPGANLVFLKIGIDDSGNASMGAMSNAIRDAVDVYNARIISMSYGFWSSYHDGSDEVSQAVDYAVSKGATVFASAGNEGADSRHYSGTIVAGGSTADIPVSIKSGSYLPMDLVWFDGAGTTNNLSLQYYGTNHALLPATGDPGSESPRGTESTSLQLNTPRSSGTCYLKVTNNSTHDQSFHIYSSDPSVTFNNPDPRYTLSSPAEADAAIAVGAYVTRTNWTDYGGEGWQYNSATIGTIANFSSRGPRVDSGASGKPDIVTPGQGIISVRDDTVYPWPSYNLNADIYLYGDLIIDNDGTNLNGSGPADYIVMQGTSMACPIAAGVGALLLSKNPTLSPAQLKQAISSTATDRGTARFDDAYGWGLVNAGAAINSIRVPEIKFTTGVQSLIAGAVSSVITIQTQDGSNNPVNVNSATTVNLTSTSGNGRFSLTNAPWVNISSLILPTGSNSVSFFYKDNLLGKPTIQAASTGYVSGTQVESIIPKLNLSGYVNSTAGTSDNFTVTSQDLLGATVTNYTGTIHFTSSDSQAVLPENYTFVSNDNGIHSFSATLKTAGTQSITATDTLNSTISATQSDITISANVKNKLIWGTQPAATVTAGDNWQAFTVNIVDQFGNPTVATDSVTIIPSSGSLGGTLSQPAVGGIATFNNITRTTTGSLTLTATSGTLLAPPSDSVTVNPASVSSLTVSGYPVPAVAGVPHNFSVTAKDTFGNTATGYTGTVHFTSSDAQALLPNNYTFVGGDNGTRSFSATLKTTGPRSITATDTLSSSISGTQSGITVNAAAASQVRVETAANGSGTIVPAQSVIAGHSITIYAVGRDQYGNYAGNPDNVTWSMTEKTGGADGDLAPLPDSKGATFSGHLMGTLKLRAISGGLTPVDSGKITIVPKLSVTGYVNSTAGTADNFTVTSQDILGATVTNYTGTIHFTSSDSQAVLPDNYTFVSNDNGIHSFSATLKTAGTQSITATDTLNSTISGTQSDITISANVKNKLIWGTQPAATVTAGDNWQAFTVNIVDQFGNPTVATDSVTIIPSSGSLGGTLSQPAVGGIATFNNITRTTTGSLTLTATSGTLLAPPSDSVTVNPASVSSLTVSGYPVPAVAGVPHNFSVTAKDTFGNTATGYTGTVHFTSSDAQALLPNNYTFVGGDNGTRSFSATLKTAGPRSITATDTLNSTISGTQSGITVNSAAASQVRVETAANGSGSIIASQNLNIGSNLPAWGITRDVFGNYVGNPDNITWSMIEKTGGVADGDLSAATGTNIVMTGRQSGSAKLHSSIAGLSSVDSGTITVLTAPVIIGGGGFGGGPPPAPEVEKISLNGLSSVAALTLDSNGRIENPAQLNSTDGNLTLDIGKSTSMTDSSGAHLKSLSASVLASPPAPPAENLMLLAYELGPEGAAFNPPLILTLRYDFDKSGVEVQRDTVTLAYWNGSQWISVPGKWDESTGTMTSQISHFSQYALIAQYFTPAKFEISDLKVTPVEIEMNANVTIQTTLTNSGDKSGRYQMELKINSIGVENREIILDGNSRKEVSFEIKASVTGENSIELNGIRGQFIVSAPPIPAPEKTLAPQTDNAPITPAANIEITPAEIAPSSTSLALTSNIEQGKSKPWIWLGIASALMLGIIGLIMLRRNKARKIEGKSV